jgi:2-polyprenyl-3-methyl-5-hydroxy-6-metoxy-1,4-benzoquinol methylase
MGDGPFEAEYFAETYGGKYRQRNPPHKWKAFLRAILQYRRNGALLDVGCAWGLFLDYAKEYFVCSGTDVSRHALAIAKGRLREQVVLFESSVGEIPGRAAYDVVTCFDVLEHCDDLKKAWRNLDDLLRPDGILALTVPVYDGPIGPLVNRLDKDATHVHRRERAFWVAEVGERFNILAYRGIIRYFIGGRVYLNAVCGGCRTWAPAIMLVVQKRPDAAVPLPPA